MADRRGWIGRIARTGAGVALGAVLPRVQAQGASAPSQGAAQGSMQSASPGWPTRPLQLVVPFPPGGGIDAAARPFAERLGALLGQPVVIDNRAGAAGNIGAEAVARATPDGHVLLFANEFLATNPALYRSLRFDPVRDFVPIAKVASTRVGVACHPSVPAADLAALLALSRTQTVNFASPGVGSGPHLLGELINLEAGARLNHVPYKGSAPAITDAVGGQVHLVITTLGPMIQHIAAGRLRGLAVSGDTRLAQLPDVPTLAQAGLASFRYENWYGAFAPAGVPAAVLERLQQASLAAARDVDVQERLRKAGYDPDPRPGDALAQLLRTDLARWARVVQDAKIPKE